MDSTPQSAPLLAANAETFAWNIRVYYEDTDVAGVVYYANYLRFLERARTEWLRATGFELDQIQREWNAVFVVKRIEADYHLPAKLGDIVSVSCEPKKVGRSKLVVEQCVLRGGSVGELLLSATVTLAYIASDLSKPIAMPAEMRARMALTQSEQQ